MSNRWSWLRDRLVELKSNPSRFAKDLDWPASRVYELFSGKTKAIPLDRVAKAAVLLGIRLDDMLNFNSGLSDNIRFSETPTGNNFDIASPIPELDMYNICFEIQSNEWDENENFLNDVSYTYNAGFTSPQRIKDNWQIPKDFLDEINTHSKNTYIIECTGDSMSPTINTGDKAIIDTSAKGRFPSPDGVFAIWDGLGIAIKRIELIPNSNPATIKIISDNPRHSTYERKVEDCKIIGRVVGAIKRI